MKDSIYKKFIDSNLEIKSNKKLKEYIDFCLSKNVRKRIKGKVSYHHILPASIFEDYKILSDNSWNSAYLLYSDHYYAHYLLVEALNNYSMEHAFISMHGRDIINGRIKEEDLIPLEEYQNIMERRTNKQQIWNETIVEFEGELLSNSKISGIKSKRTQSKTFKDDQGNITSIHKEVGKRMANTRKLEYIDELGNITNNYKEVGKKLSKIKNEIFINEMGEETSIFKESAKKCARTVIDKGPRFVLMNIDGRIINENIAQGDLRKIYQKLDKTSKENYYGKSNQSKSKIIKNGKEDLIGLYVIPLSSHDKVA